MLDYIKWMIAGVVIIGCLALYRFILRVFFGMVIIPDDSIGVITKKFVIFGKNTKLPDGKIIALNGEAGYQADTLAPGLHWGLWLWQYDVEKVKFVLIPQGKMGCIEACDGDAMPSGRIVAKSVQCDSFQNARKFLENGGQRGPQIDVIPPGTYRINTLLFKVGVADAVVIPTGKLGIVEAKDGAPLPSGRVLARAVDCNSYQDAAIFMTKGERGPQSNVITPGTYRINPYMFLVQMAETVDIPDNKVGVVTTREGIPLNPGDIAGPAISGHNMYQSPQAFIDAGGNKGLQEQVLLAGRYFINPRFASVDIVDMTEVPIANVGVMISYVGKEGKDVTGDSFKHGNLVSPGEKGVCVNPLDPGKYPLNPYIYKVSNVPTANVVLNWATGKSEAHELDKDLSTITVRSGDGFKFNLDVSQIIHIPRNDAPKVIARFGDMESLVTQVLEPTIGNYFRNAAQSSDIIDFLKNRTKRQTEARDAISAALKDYNVGAVDTLIGDIVPPEQLMKTLTDRKIAEQEQITYGTQKQAQTVKQELAQATALAETQATVVAAERQVSIAEFNAKASVANAEGQAKSKTINATADANVVATVGNAEATKVRAVGSAEADVIKMKIASMEAGNYAVVQVAQALAAGNIKLVPDVTVNGSGGTGSGTLVDVLLANLIRQGK